MQNCPEKPASWADFCRSGLDERFARLRHERFWNPQTRDVARTVPGKHAVRSLGLDELDLDDGWTRLVDARDTPTRHRLQGEQRHGCGAVACGGR